MFLHSNIEPCSKLAVDLDQHWAIVYHGDHQTDQSLVSHETIATYKCVEGYRGGISTHTCNRGTWSSRATPPECEPGEIRDQVRDSVMCDYIPNTSDIFQ